MESSLTADTGVLSSVVPEQERRALVSQLGALLMPEGTIMVGDFGYSETHPYPLERMSLSTEERTFATNYGVWIHHFTQPELEALLSQAFVIHRSTEVPV